MKKAAIITLAFLVLIPLGLAAQSSDTSSNSHYAASYARLTYVQGDVFVQRTAGLGTEKAEVNLALVQGDTLGTGAGQAEVDFGRRNFIRLAENTKVEFAILPTEGNDHVKLHVLEGSAYLRVSSLSVEKAFEVHSPDMSSYVLEEGLYRFNVVANGQTEVLVSEGSLEAAGEEGSVVVHARESVSAEDGRLLGAPAYSNARTDAFDQWNASRDALFAQRSTKGYLPSQIDEYQEELDQNGQWTYEQPYGYVWSPYGVDADWRPYMYGRWSWYPYLGWNWISSEPWGWSVYHYGRWQWRFGLGWYWIPHYDFGPAWVNWWWDNDYIGWCPLSWYNRPGVLFGDRFYDRYREPFFPHDNRAMSVIRRDRLQDPNLGHHVLRGGELSRVDRISLRAQQPGFRPGIGRSSLQSPEAQRVFANHAGIRGEAKNYAPGSSVSASRLRQGDAGAPARSANGARSIDRNNIAPSRSQLNGSGVSQGQRPDRSIRVYPGGSASSPSRQDSGARSSASRSGDSAARVSPSVRGTTSSPSANSPRTAERSTPSANSPRSAERSTNGGSQSSGSTVRSGEKIKQYPSASMSRSSTAGRSSSSSSAGQFRPDSSLYARTYPSRVSQGSSSGSRTVREYSSGLSRSTAGRTSSYSAPSRTYASPSGSSSRSYSQSPRYNPRSYSYSRPSTPSYSGSTSSRYSAPSQSRSSSSYSAPSRSNYSSGRSYSAPRSSGSSVSRSSAPSRSSSSSHSSSSSSHSSGRRKG